MRDIGVKIVFSKLDRDVTTRGRSYPDNGAFREEMKSWDPYPGTHAPTDVLKSQAEQYASCSRSSPITRTTSPASVSGTSTTARLGSTSGPGNAPTIPSSSTAIGCPSRHFRPCSRCRRSRSTRATISSSVVVTSKSPHYSRSPLNTPQPPTSHLPLRTACRS